MLVIIGLIIHDCASSASAQVNITSAPMARDLDARARLFWGRYGVAPCGDMTIYRQPIVGGLGYTPIGGCAVTIDEATWNGAQGWPLTFLLENRRNDLCRVWVHEYGHSAGLWHAEGWVMDGHGLVHMPVIGECNRFARGES